MKFKAVYRAFMVLCLYSGLSVAQATDDVNFPSSVAPGQFSFWKKMHPSTFDLTVEMAGKQCERAQLTETWLMPKHCQQFVNMLKAGQCTVVAVPDGVRFDRLLGRLGGSGRSEAWPKQEKQTGRQDRALLCDVGDGITMYWFTGDKGKSCNNVAIVYNPPKPVPTTPRPPRVVCVDEKFDNSPPPDQGQFLPGTQFEVCDCCGNTKTHHIPALYIPPQGQIKSSMTVSKCITFDEGN